MPIKYTKEQLEPIIKKSNHWAEVCRTLGLKPFSGSQSHIKKVVIEFGLDYSHFLGKAWNKGKTFPPKRELKKYLNNEISINSHNLKKRLIKEGFKKSQCENCGLSKWCEQVLPLELDHINGNPADNTLENLKILCPNCHAIKTRYERRKNKKERIKRFKTWKACTCGELINKKSLMCRKCSYQKRERINWPDTTWLLTELKRTNYTALARKLGVTDNAIRKRVKNHTNAGMVQLEDTTISKIVK